MISKEAAYSKISGLVNRFEEQYESYKNSDYNETLTRRDFIDPFFKALGWDIDNEQGFAEDYREVIHEDKVKVGNTTRTPDYSFRIGGKRLFFVEAKKPSIVVKDEIPPAYQIRCYGWSGKLSVSIVTDFEEFSIYDCTVKPVEKDKASKARIRYFTFRDYLKEFDFIWGTFSKECVQKGGFDKFVKSDTHKKGTSTVDQEFLKSLDNWRTYLATSISWNNKELDEDEINFAVQQTIDRIIFLRIAEGRGVEPENSLKLCTHHGDFYKNLFEEFRKADEKYNSGLFDLKKDRISERLKIDNKVIKNIIADLYYPSPYAFSCIPIEILGTAYEQFLGKVIRITPSHHAKIEEKPEVRKAGGVYYTPQYIVDYIVENTVGKLVEGKTPKEISKIKILDPACGSGSFLLGAYQYLLDWHKKYYSQNGKPSKGRKEELLTPEGKLTTAEKKRILINNIYGVDIDVNAVEVTKLSLLLKCMEGETEASISNQLRMFHERVLPSLENNIKDGNSLIDEDYYAGDLFETEKKIKPFSWKKAFPEIFKIQRPDKNEELKWHAHRVEKLAEEATERSAELIKQFGEIAEEPGTDYGDRGFDVVIGNPPYVRQELLGAQKPYFHERYRVYHGMADLYSYFIEKGIGLLNNNGLYGIIVANKWMRSNYGEPLRKWLKNQSLYEIIDFGDLPVFETATTYPCILIAGKPQKTNKKIEVTAVQTLDYISLSEYVKSNRKIILKEQLEDSGWNLAGKEEIILLKKLQQNSVTLGEYVKGKIYRGVLTGYNEAFVIDKETRSRLIKNDKKSGEIIKPFLAGRDIKRYQSPQSDKFLILFEKGFTNKKGNNPQNAWKWLQDSYPAIAAYLEPFKRKAEKRYDKGEYWWELRACDYYPEFEKPKIMYQVFQVKPCFIWDDDGMYCNNAIWIIPQSDKFFLAYLNSPLGWYLISSYCTKIQNGYQLINKYLEKIPVKKIDLANNKEKSFHDKIVKLTDHILQLNKEINETKLESKINQLKSRVEYYEDEINKLIYLLYELTPDEIKIVEEKNDF